ncbi:glycosyltransferase family 2 protein [Microbacterium sp. SLBN-146]|uniref:glycosyltransferase n=1 Tax=Microbacterium sp. SLBN-146 TaxID=2768457 RepID=UPI00114DC804|nr:glycosyltransferase family 2 protein [Microbacterium sp. SLBN-146]TQJ30612.1 glycosyl transferase family 2 [Microbacterium sp. SLBN-146]
MTTSSRPDIVDVSVVIAAYNEESVIGACLDALLSEGVAAENIIVSANACRDRTVEVAQQRGVTTIDRAEPGKAAALNAADAVATTFPRIYLDADIRVPRGSVSSLVGLLESGALAAVPRRRLATAGSPVLVKAYSAINERLPVFRTGLFGRGMIAVSQSGRARFAQFPAMVADDLFLDSQFTPAERAEATDVVVTVEAPRTTRALLNRLVRVRRGNAEMREAATAGELNVAVRRSDRWSWLRDVVLPNPWLVFAAVPYVALTALAGALARRTRPSADAWGRDETTRTTNARESGARS